MPSPTTAYRPVTDDVLTALAAGRIRLRSDDGDPGDDGVTGQRTGLVWEHPTWGLLPDDDVWAAARRQGACEALRRLLRAG